MNPSIQGAIDPQHQVIVTASAGSGKTYLLVSRLLRLLLDGASPGGLLAITFTRKAAAEMQQRLHQRLQRWLWLDDKQLADDLRDFDIPVNIDVLDRARRLYEAVLAAAPPVRITTFHAFCQDILRRFPFEAGVAANFELMESTGLLEDTAWNALWLQATVAPDSDDSRDMQLLLKQCGSIDNTRLALSQFLAHRSDWWALTSGIDNPVTHVTRQLLHDLHIDPDRNPAETFFTARCLDDIRAFQALLIKNPTATNEAHARQLAIALDNSLGLDKRLLAIETVMLTRSHNTPRQHRASKKHLNESEQIRFQTLSAALASQVLVLKDQQARQLTWRLSDAWYRSGERLLDQYQKLKQQQRLLDFSDLEWHACQLLNLSDNSHWIQYKLDQRIDHILVDEFQDTNPTQWRLLLPLLEELAASGNERARSVFLVGDEKQSIYRFRRAEPRLFAAARDWMQQHLDAITVPLNKSWRSSPAITDFINAVFTQSPLQQILPDFPRHETHLSLPGFVEFLPLIPAVREDHATRQNTLRYPLHEPRPDQQDPRYEQEGRLIAARIGQLIEQRTMVNCDGETRLLGYQDIMILVRKRTHLDAYEKALREAGIPYIGGGRDSVLDHQESFDLSALLTVLITPFDNLALATVLRSPLFACSDDDLMHLARTARRQETTSNWYHALLSLDSREADDSALARAGKILPRWMALADQLPVHDLLDRIYHEGQIMARYRAAVSPQLQKRVLASLEKILELALEIDSGRYPSLGHFLNRLQRLRQHDKEALAGPATDHDGRAVRILTIHAAKGLESPVVFVADTGFNAAPRKAFHAVIDWPAGSARPDLFLLAGRKNELDSWTRERLETIARHEQREAANLLYVAISRARQILVVSGCESKKSQDHDWYQLLATPFDESIAERGGIVSQYGAWPVASPEDIAQDPADQPPAPLPAIILKNAASPQNPGSRDITTVPAESGSVAVAVADDSDSRIRGQIIHRLLDYLTKLHPRETKDLAGQVAAEFGRDRRDELLVSCLSEAESLLQQPSLQTLFTVKPGNQAYNEVPVNFYHNGRPVSGVIDRLLVSNNEAIIIDYKTNRQARPDNLASLAAAYQAQLDLYATGIRQLWPQQRVRRIVIFTACATAYEFA